MHPSISRFPAELIYPSLSDGANTEDNSELDGRYDRSWPHDAPVVLADTESLDAWVSTVDRGTKSSRLNFMSAALSADIAANVLTHDRQPAAPGDDPRILIVNPSRPQADLIQHLILHQGLGDDVAVGTAHSFQGNEAPVVILDLVVDEPHWRVGMFIPQYDSGTKRLMNVAVTRARSRLIIVGDFAYILSKGKKAFLARMVRHFEQVGRRVDAAEMLSSSLSAKAAAAHLAGIGGALEADNERLVTTQATFDRYLLNDLASAVHKVVIYSPFLTGSRLDKLLPHLDAARTRGVSVYVVTKAWDDRSKRDLAAVKLCENRLRNVGVVVVHKRAMHEKVILIDDEVSWVGSLNPLSFRDTVEIMERRASRAVVRDYRKTLKLDDLLPDTADDVRGCPACEAELDAAEGDRGPYWRCPNGCYTRSLDQTPPKNGRLPCPNCGARVRYGEWGGEPHWRCTSNHRHRMRVRRGHLRLPKMRRMVPADVQATLNHGRGFPPQIRGVIIYLTL